MILSCPRDYNLTPLRTNMVAVFRKYLRRRHPLSPFGRRFFRDLIRRLPQQTSSSP
jgi:hypothetical protein